MSFGTVFGFAILFRALVKFQVLKSENEFKECLNISANKGYDKNFMPWIYFPLQTICNWKKFHFSLMDRFLNRGQGFGQLVANFDGIRGVHEDHL